MQRDQANCDIYFQARDFGSNRDIHRPQNFMRASENHEVVLQAPNISVRFVFDD